MPFIGNQPALSYTSFAKQDFTTSATTSYTLNNPVANANELALFINFVRQEPTTAYTASGTTLTLTSATSASDDMYCVYLGKAVQTVNPPNGSVGTAQLASTAVTPAKMDLSQDYTFTGKISGQNYPAFEAYLSADQSVTNVTWTKVQCNTEVFDTDSAYDNSTNYRFTVPTGKGGKYLVYSRGRLNSSGTDRMNECFTAIYKNGSSVTQNSWNFGTHKPTIFQGYDYIVIDLAVSDYIEFFVYINATSGTPSAQGNATLRRTNFGAFRIGD
jgi:hypothetical protein